MFFFFNLKENDSQLRILYPAKPSISQKLESTIKNLLEDVIYQNEMVEREETRYQRLDVVREQRQ